MSMLKRFSAKITVGRGIRRHSPSLKLWPSLRSLWASSPCLYLSAIGPSAVVPLELAALRRLCAEPDEAESLLYGLLLEPNPMLVAYGLSGLQMIKSSKLEQLPDSVFARC